MIHVGILLCDEHYPEAVEQFGSYDTDFKRMLSAKGNSHWRFSLWRCYLGQMPPAAETCDAWIISGSMSSAYESVPWINDLKKFIRQVNEVQKKLLGVCFGHQIIHSALGGEVIRSPHGWAVGAYPVTLYERLFTTNHRQTLKILAIHQDQVATLAKGFTVVGGCTSTPYAITRKKNHILTFQGHPEFEDGFYRGLCQRIRDCIGHDKVTDVLQTMGQPDDRKMVRQTIRHFFMAHHPVATL